MITLKEQSKFISKRGWYQWYNILYWVNPKTVEDPTQQDYTNYGMDLNSAYCFEKLNLPKFKPGFLGLPILSMQAQGLDNKQKIEYLLKKLEKSDNSVIGVKK